jgi:hypothetical protein
MLAILVIENMLKYTFYCRKLTWTDRHIEVAVLAKVDDEARQKVQKLCPNMDEYMLVMLEELI